MPRKNLDEYTYISLQISKEFLGRITEAMEQEGLISRSCLIRHLLHAWLTEVERAQADEVTA